ncbi:hypothetical protein [Spartinivicinus ruber]|uniref:hypothetical protein n=1 Tax=Spartinivicinus ruber TaxID=2683272 RepID=UPI0013D7D2A0|nr:hypothetical protein [Spartinivicinus ruber]
MQTETNNNAGLADAVATGKDLIAMLRDAALLLIAILLIGWPQKVNSILVEAGFEEGSFAGMKWKAKLTQSDEVLIEAQAIITDFREQNKKLGVTLTELRQQMTSTETKEKLAKLDQQNELLLTSSAQVQQKVTNTTSANALLVKQAQTITGETGKWGVVYGGDSILEDAKYEINTIASNKKTDFFECSSV